MCLTSSSYLAPIKLIYVSSNKVKVPPLPSSRPDALKYSSMELEKKTYNHGWRSSKRCDLADAGLFMYFRTCRLALMAMPGCPRKSSLFGIRPSPCLRQVPDQFRCHSATLYIATMYKRRVGRRWPSIRGKCRWRRIPTVRSSASASEFSIQALCNVRCQQYLKNLSLSQWLMMDGAQRNWAFQS